MVKERWKDTLLWAVLAAMLLEFGINFFSERSIWHRISALEQRFNVLEKALEKRLEK